jgi:hypothetical protein
MAGAGYRLFNTGDVLTAAQVNNYLQEQVIMVFADSTARTTALSGVVSEGMFSYLTNTNAFQYYNGAAWADVSNPGDITAVNVTSPITGGGSSGAVTIGVDAASTAAAGVVQLSDSTSTTSSTLASTPTATKAAYDLADAAIAKSLVTTEGDIIYRDGSAPARLGIGTAGQVLAVNSGATAPEWATLPSPTFIGVQAYRVDADGNVTIPAFTNTAIPFPAETFDTNTFHSTSTNTSRFTIPAGKAGKYLAVFGGRQNTAPTDYFQLRILVNGASPASLDVLSENQTSRNAAEIYTAFLVGSQILNLVESDYVELTFRSGTAVTATVDAWFNLTYLGA